MTNQNAYEKIRRIAREIAITRSGAHKHDGWERPLCDNFHYIGAIGEVYVAYLYGWKADKEPRAYGDGGIDFTVPCKGNTITIDVKTSRLMDGMRVEQWKSKADVYFFCYYNKKVDWVEFVGWCLKKEVVSYKPRDTGRGVINHFVPAHELYEPGRIALKMIRPVLLMPDKE